LLHRVTQCTSLGPQPLGLGLLALCRQQFGHRQACREEIALQLNRRQWKVRLSAIGMHHSIACILPTLIIVAPGTASGVLQEPISIPVTAFVAPAHGVSSRLEMRLEELIIAGPAPGMPEGQAVESRHIM